MPEPVGSVELTVEESVHFSLDGDNALAEWASTSPAGYGYVRLGEPSRFLCTSMFHQYHCLRRLRLALANPTWASSSVSHGQHCLNYLRQAILCSPDLTLEPADMLERNFTTSRVGMTHTCRDWTAVYTELDENYARWRRSGQWLDDKFE